MLSTRTEMFVVGALIVHIASGFRFQPLQDLLSTFVGKVLALAGIVYVHKKLSCSVSLLLAIVYLRSCASSWEGFVTPTSTVQPTTTCPNGYAYDTVTKACKPSSAMSGSVAPSAVDSGVGASVSTPPPTPAISTAPMTTPTATMPPAPPTNTPGGVQPAAGTSSVNASL